MSYHKEDTTEQRMIDGVYTQFVRQFNYKIAIATQPEINPKAHWHGRGSKIKEVRPYIKPRIRRAHACTDWHKSESVELETYTKKGNNIVTRNRKEAS